MDNIQNHYQRFFRLLIVVLVALLFVFSFTASGYEAGPPPPTDEPDISSRGPETTVIRDPILDKSIERASKGFESSLAFIMEDTELSVQERTDHLAANGYKVTDQRIQVQIAVDPRNLDDVISSIKVLGGEITKVSDSRDQLQCWIPLSNINQLNKIKGVYKIYRPPSAYPADVHAVGSSTSEGVSVMNVEAWHTAGFTGNGVKVGIIDTGFLGYPGLLGTDLPSSVTVKNFIDGETDSQVNGTSVHGAAGAEIIHDIAPGAELFFAKVGTDLDFQEAMLWLKDTHQVDVISSALSFFNLTPGDGTGNLADWVNQARSAGIFWATAAGNYRENHWGGTFSDTDADFYHNFGSFNETCLGPLGSCYLLSAGESITVYLRWDDWTGVTQDYDLVLWRTTDFTSWTNHAMSVDLQNGSPGQTPTEEIVTVATGGDAYYLPAVLNWLSSRNVEFELFSFEWPLEHQVYARSITNLADAPGAMTVAAQDVVSPYLQEVFSSEGPSNGPGGAQSGGFIKPDISAFSNISTESYGPGAFAGSSPATSHVAGAAALIKSVYPSYTPDQIQTYLETNAVDMGPPGMDTMYGYGRLLLLDPPNLLYLPLILR